MFENNKICCNYLLSGGEGHLPQRWSCEDQGAEIRPSQNHCRSGSKVEFAPKNKVIHCINLLIMLEKFRESTLAFIQCELVL